MVRAGVISDEFWAVVEPLLPVNGGRRGRPWNDHRDMLEAICWRYRTGSPLRDLPQELGRWQTVWARHFRWSTGGTYDRILTAAKSSGLLGAAETDAVLQLLSVDSTVVRAHQHAAGARKKVASEVVSKTGEGTGAWSNYTNLPVEPADHALGRSRGGLSTKIHTLTDQRCCR